MRGRTFERTDLRLINSGRFAKIGKRHFRHESGKEIMFVPSKGWVCNGWIWPSLHAAASEIDRIEAGMYAGC